MTRVHPLAAVLQAVMDGLDRELEAADVARLREWKQKRTSHRRDLGEGEDREEGEVDDGEEHGAEGGA